MSETVKLLRILKGAGWTSVPPAWRDELRRALTTGIVTVGFGGVLKLTEAGEAMLRKPPADVR